MDGEAVDVPLQVEKLDFDSIPDGMQKLAVLVENGSFNPPTYMHLRMFDLGKEALKSHGYHFIGGYMSPVNDAYKKPGLAPAEHRIKMCECLADESPFIMVDPWEALQPTYQRSLYVLARVKEVLCHMDLCNGGALRVMLLCGADLLESFTIPGAWIPEQVEMICRDYGLVCIRRGGKDLIKMISDSDLLSRYKENIIIVDDFESDISSTKVRETLSKGLEVKDLIPDGVFNYIKTHQLYNVLV